MDRSLWPVRTRRLSVVGIVCVCLCLSHTTALLAAETYVQAFIDHSGQLRVTTRDGRQLAPKKDDERCTRTQTH